MRTSEFPRVEALLDQWGRWRSGGLGELGYGSIAHRYQKFDTPRPDGVLHDDPGFDRKMLDIDRCVGNLPPDYQAVVMSFHCIPEHVAITERARKTIEPSKAKTIEQRARELRVAVSTYYRRLRAAHAELAQMRPFK